MAQLNILKKASELFADKFILPQIIEAAETFWSERVKHPKLLKDVQKWLVEKYGNEPFFDDLDKYLAKNNTINRLISISYGESGFEKISSKKFQLKHYHDFTVEYPQYAKPEYKKSIDSIFGELFNKVFDQINSLPKDLNKLWNKINCLSNDQKAEIEGYFDSGKKDILDEIRKSGCNGTFGAEAFSADLHNTSPELQKFFDRIREIEDGYHKNKLFPDAIKEYTQILSELSLLNIQRNSIEYIKLISALNCNMALCYSNTGDRNTAQSYLTRIPKDISETNPKYHFIYAAVIVNSDDINHYMDALYHARRAVEIDQNYSKAFVLEKNLNAILQPENVTEILSQYDLYFDEHFPEKSESQLYEYYYNRGLIQLAGTEFEGALVDLENASKYGDDQMLKFHTAFVLYSIAIKPFPKNTRIMFRELQQKPLLRAYGILSGILNKDDSNPLLWKHIVSVYISVCFLLGMPCDHIYDKVIDIIDDIDAEIRRVFLMDCENVPDEILEKYLDKQDIDFLRARNYMNASDYGICQSFIEKLLNDESRIEPHLYLMLMQSCIGMADTEKYWNYRAKAGEYHLEGPYIQALDARAYELEGKISRAKELLDKIALTTVDQDIFINIIRFYGRNEFIKEKGDLYTSIYHRWHSGELYISDIGDFISEYVCFLTNHQDDTAITVLEDLPVGTLTENRRNKLYANFYQKKNSPEKLLQYAKSVFHETLEFNHGMILAKILQSLFKYDEAISVYETLIRNTKDDDETVEIYQRLSDVNFLKGDKDSSYRWAKQARDAVDHIPSNEIHQMFFGRSIICGHSDEGLKILIDYKHEHPVVVDFLEEIQISSESCSKEKSDEILEAIGFETEKQDKRLKEIVGYYKKKALTTNCVLKSLCENWCGLLSFAYDNKLNVDFDDEELLRNDIKSFDGKVVIDAQTLLILEMFDCTGILDYIDSVYVNAGSVDYLQNVCFSLNCPWAIAVLNHIRNADNIIIAEDGFVGETELEEVFGRNFIICCEFAKKNNIAFLYHDAIARAVWQDVRFISISAICGCVHPQDNDIVEQWRYNLLSGCQFISFSENTILHQIRSSNYKVTQKLIEPFLCCNSDCDMRSFARVYCKAVYDLHEGGQYSAAEDLALIIINNTKRLLNKGQHYRAYSDVSQEYYNRAKRIIDYAAIIWGWLMFIFPQQSEIMHRELNSLFVMALLCQRPRCINEQAYLLSIRDLYF